MSLDIMFPQTVFTEGELSLVAERFNHPVIKKYLVSIGVEASKELLQISVTGRSDLELAKIHARVHGRLETLNTLLSIISINQE